LFVGHASSIVERMFNVLLYCLYNSAGIHLLRISCKVVSSEANLPILPKILLAVRYKERFAASSEHLNLSEPFLPTTSSTRRYAML